MRAMVIVLALAVAAMAQVTPEDIEKQKEVVAKQEAALAKLEGEYTAQGAQSQLDSTLKAAGVQVLPYERDLGGMYVIVDVPYTKWGEIQQLKWKLLLDSQRALKIGQTGVVGRYSIRKDRLPAFLRAIEGFLAPERVAIEIGG